MRRLLVLALSLPALLAGCGGATTTAGSVPESASLAPADAIAYVTLVTDEGSTQWKRAERLLELIPGSRDTIVSAIEDALADENLTWSDDVAPAIGPEVVVVVTGGREPIVLTRPESDAKLTALLENADQPSDQPVVQAQANGWTAIAQEESHLSAYRSSIARGTLATVEDFTTAMEQLPPDALARAWVDARPLTKELGSPVEIAGTEVDFGLETLSAAVSAEDDGILLDVAFTAPQGTGTTHYEPKLVARVPADAVAAISFGGTQGILDRIQGSIDIDAVSRQLEDAVGVSLGGIVDALSGEGVLYVRDGGGSIPEVTLVLTPPDPDETIATIDRVARQIAEQADGQVSTAPEDGVDVSVVTLGDVALRYARLDEDTVIVTTGANGIREFKSDGPRLVSTSGFERAADQVGLDDRTRGFVYVDIDGLVPFIEGLVGTDGVPDEAREILGKLDSFILQIDGDGESTRASGFVRVND